MIKQRRNLFAGIYVGSEQVSLQIVEYTTLQDITIIEQASREVSLGEETFKYGSINFATVSEICDLLKGYKRLLQEYGVRDYWVVATTAIREAANQYYIIDQIKIKTGFDVKVIDMPQEIFYKYVTLFKTVDDLGLTKDEDGILFVDISSGGLGITLYLGGELKYQQNIHLGALRIKESFDKYQRDSLYFYKALAEYIYSTIEPVKQEIYQYKVKYLVLSGVEMPLLLKMLGRDAHRQVESIGIGEFENLHEQVKNLNLPQLMKRYQLLESKAEMVLPTIALCKQIVSLTSVKQIYIPSGQVLHGLTTLHIAIQTKNKLCEVITGQIISLALHIGKKFKFDQAHSCCVETISLQIFDKMIKVHGLGTRERLLLQVSAILHDIGKYVCLRRHYFYSYRLIISSDILGFSEDDKMIMGNVAYYHSKGTPSEVNPYLGSLSREQKVLVSKLSAIIRLADALDRSHRQKIRQCDIALREDTITFQVTTADDYALEEWTFEEKSAFFAEVFGMRAILKKR